ncbi:ATP-binding cassette domain-containing protein [Maribellus luteus]|uniref:ATP-binding cassette domain-containing protein n=1 Tax=Maribellus luteus TaxID=2305463 RepID=A0A399STN7_9BACT|nr:AAA family ATPase [Maribellus luteus]RIJ45493.1 ATP-binding cassette domain-containing protein [Maribellus luteus]
MKIKTIEINNYKAFYGKHKIKINKRNVFIYGENGSGKSSLYYALKDFVQSSMETINLNEVENIFIPGSKQGNCFVNVKLQPRPGGNPTTVQEYKFGMVTTNTNLATDTTIKDIYHLKSFLTYKSLLDIHHLKKNDEIDLFNLLVNGVLKHFKYALTGGKELGELWNDVKILIAKETDSSYNTPRKKRDVDAALTSFNDAFSQLFIEPTATSPNPEYILTHALPILTKFGHNIDLKLSYIPARPNPEYDSLERGNVRVQLTYADTPVTKPHLFLNEARLSAIAISIYLGMIRRHPQLIRFKMLFLDDIFIGLDISNRLPLLKILEDDFSDYQVILTTYDKPWYEYAKGFLNGNRWKTIEFYAQEVNGGYEVPKIDDNTDLLDKSQEHFNNSDYKASAVYARSAFEQIIMNYCAKKRKPLPFKKKSKDYSSQDFWNYVYPDVAPATKTDIEQYRFLIYNALSHYDPEINPLKSELNDAIQAVRDLRTELNAIP